MANDGQPATISDVPQCQPIVPGASSACNCSCACDCSPSWYLQKDALILQRSNGSITRPVVVSDATGATVLTTHSPDLDYRFGPRILVGYQTAPGRAWELSYFGIQFGTSRASATDPNNLDLAGPVVAVADDFDNADRMRLSYRSQLQNAEFNMVRGTGNWSMLAGFRYLNLGERFNINSLDSDGDISDYTVHTSNNLFGGQLGTRLQGSLGERLGWNVTGKAGIFGNDAIQSQVLMDNNNTFVLRQNTSRRGAVAFVGDLNLSGTYRLNGTWSVVGGYFLLYAAGVALAPDQLDFTNTAASGTRITTRGDLFLHGANVGLLAGW
jgi:hypothetical protein